MSPIGYDDLHDIETRVTNAASGGQKGTKLTQVGALDPVALIEVSRVAGFGAAKYSAFNFLKGYDWALSFNALQRHALLFWAGEDRDEESGQLHMAMAAWHALTLVSFMSRGVGEDTRPPRLGEASPSAAEIRAMTDLVPVISLEELQARVSELNAYADSILPSQFQSAEARHEDLLWAGPDSSYPPVAEAPLDVPPCGDHRIGEDPECCGALSPATGLA